MPPQQLIFHQGTKVKKRFFSINGAVAVRPGDPEPHDYYTVQPVYQIMDLNLKLHKKQETNLCDLKSGRALRYNTRLIIQKSKNPISWTQSKM